MRDRRPGPSLWSLADEPTIEHATCVGCIGYTPQIRPAGQPAPKRPRRGKRPTPAQRELLVLIDAGKVATVSHLRGGTDVRIPSQPSNSARCGALGQKVTAQARTLEAAGWACEVKPGARDTPWVLTDAGRASCCSSFTRRKGTGPAPAPQATNVRISH